MAKRKSDSKLFLIILLIVVAFAAAIFYVTFFLPQSGIKYPEFGIEIPRNYSLHGIDVSRHQRVINWEQVKDMKVKNIKIGFAFIKATEGVDKIDVQFRRNWFHAEKQNIPRGAYHFFIAGKSGKAQADNFIETVKLKKGDLPPVLDIEETYGTPKNEMLKNVRDWIEKIEQAYKVKPIIYTNINFYYKFLKEELDDYPFWIAHYFQTRKPRIGRKWIFWQHSEKGRVNGIKTPVDFNVFSGDSTDFRELLIQ